jgi:hypothetical protein
MTSPIARGTALANVTVTAQFRKRVSVEGSPGSRRARTDASQIKTIAKRMPSPTNTPTTLNIKARPTSTNGALRS